ncbi:MAG: gamma carbonic anhydrase family protein [Hyphomicrobiales bacterium]|nr:MAG: gamma carbonic anhydrase family protein [Hyphomicrobiales bacterium]
MALYQLDDQSPVVPEADKYWVADDAHVIGNIVLNDDVGIWFGSVLRGDNEKISIGARTNIQEHSILHTDMGYPLVIGEGCTIGHRAILHGCTIADNSLIGMGATILNGAQIGRYCIIGANALVPEGMVIPDYSLVVGIPGKIIRELGTEIENMLESSATNYVQNWKRHAKNLKKLDK